MYTAYHEGNVLIGPLDNEELALWEAAKTAGITNISVRVGTGASELAVPLSPLTVVKFPDGGFVKFSYSGGSTVPGFKSAAAAAKLDVVTDGVSYLIYDRNRFDALNGSASSGMVTDLSDRLTYALEEDQGGV